MIASCPTIQNQKVVDSRLNDDGVTKTSALNIMGRTTKVSYLKSNKELDILRRSVLTEADQPWKKLTQGIVTIL